MSFTDPKMLDLLRCPESGSKLELLPPGQIEQLNRLLDEQQLFDRSGQTISEKLEFAAINQEQSWIYPVRNGIISLIKDKAIAGKAIATTTPTNDGTNA